MKITSMFTGIFAGHIRMQSPQLMQGIYPMGNFDLISGGNLYYLSYFQSGRSGALCRAFFPSVYRLHPDRCVFSGARGFILSRQFPPHDHIRRRGRDPDHADQKCRCPRGRCNFCRIDHEPDKPAFGQDPSNGDRKGCVVCAK